MDPVLAENPKLLVKNEPISAFDVLLASRICPAPAPLGCTELAQAEEMLMQAPLVPKVVASTADAANIPVKGHCFRKLDHPCKKAQITPFGNGPKTD